jgi:hypothetical protein
VPRGSRPIPLGRRRGARRRTHRREQQILAILLLLVLPPGDQKVLGQLGEAALAHARTRLGPAPEDLVLERAVRLPGAEDLLDLPTTSSNMRILRSRISST